LKTDKGHQRQISRLGELVSDKEKIKQWKPSLENGKDLSQLLMKEVSAENSNLQIMWKSAMHILNWVS
jgi:hypothetical protein